MTITAVFAASLSSLFYEILLSYFFAETQWNSLYFFVISISLFGYSAGGVIVNLCAGTGKGDQSGIFSRLISVSLFILAAGIILSYITVNSLESTIFESPSKRDSSFSCSCSTASSRFLSPRRVRSSPPPLPRPAREPTGYTRAP